MKLVIDLRMINTSGIGTYLKNVIPGILDNFQKVVFLGDVEELKTFKWTKSFEVIEFREKIYSIKEQFAYPKIIPECDVFWCPHFNVPLLPIKAEKIITTIYDVNHLSGINSISFLRKKYAYLLYKNAINRSVLILTISEFSKEELIKYTNADSKKIHVVYCGVNRDFFANGPIDSNLKLPENYFLFVGNVKPHKNLITLLKAYLILADEIKAQYKIVIVGKKEGFITEDNKIFEFIEENNLQENIFFTGYIKDEQIPTVYKKAYLFAFPSLYEGFGLPILEAIVCKTPVISSTAASLPEVGGDLILYFEALDFECLSREITYLVQNPTERLGLIEKAMPRADFFTWEKTIQSHLEAFKTL